MLAAFVFARGEAGPASGEPGALSGQDFLASGEMVLSYQFSEVFISAVGQDGFLGECLGQVFVGLENGPVLIDDLANVW